jgi:hypothetical protein
MVMRKLSLSFPISIQRTVPIWRLNIASIFSLIDLHRPRFRKPDLVLNPAARSVIWGCNQNSVLSAEVKSDPDGSSRTGG